MQLSSGQFGEYKARGIFKKENRKPVAGDNVIIENNVICDILPRKNMLIRPPCANLDNIVFVVSTTMPSPNLLLVDGFIAVAEYLDLTPIIAVTKTDLREAENILSIYPKIGIKTIITQEESSLNNLKNLLENKITLFTGNTGVGKSTLINRLTGLELKTGIVSKKLRRGKHTTTSVELHEYGGGYILDSPGFWIFDINEYVKICKRDLANCFREFSGGCKFSDCQHTSPSGCTVYEAVKNGEIHNSRYNNYLNLLSVLPNFV